MLPGHQKIPGRDPGREFRIQILQQMRLDLLCGRTGICISSREQHIRREKATSNICSNQSLNSIAAAVYLALIGEEGMKKVGQYCFNSSHYMYGRLKQVRGVKIISSPLFFNEFVWEVENAKQVFDVLYRKKIIAGYYLGNDYPQYKNAILSCCKEKKSKTEIDEFIVSLAEVLRG